MGQTMEKDLLKGALPVGTSHLGHLCPWTPLPPNGSFYDPRLCDGEDSFSKANSVTFPRSGQGLACRNLLEQSGN